MEGADYPPYPDSILKCFRGGLWQHGRDSDNGLPLYTNSTLVPNRSGSGPDQAPYQRGTIDGSAPAGGDDGGCIEDTTAPTGPWPTPYPDNTFSADGTFNLKKCAQTGFDAVQVRRSWHGTWGYDSLNGNVGMDKVRVEGCGVAGFGPESSFYVLAQEADRTKYLTLTVEATVNYSDVTTPANNHTSHVKYRVSTDALSGLYTPSWISDPIPNDSNSALSLFPSPSSGNMAVNQLAIGRWTLQNVIDHMVAYGTAPIGGSVTWTGDGSTGAPGLIQVKDASGNIIEEVKYNFDEGTFTRKIDKFNASINTEHILDERVNIGTAGLDYYSFTNTYPTDDITKVLDPISSIEIIVTGTLSDTNRDVDVRADGKTLLDFRRINDGKFFRTDAMLNVATLFSRNERQNADVKTVFTSFIGYDYATVIDADVEPNGRYGLLIIPDKDSASWIASVEVYFDDSFEYPVAMTPINRTAGFEPPFSYAGHLAAGISFDTSTGIISGTVTEPGYIRINVFMSREKEFFTGKILGMLLPDALIDGSSDIANPDFEETAGAYYANFFDFRFTDYLGCHYESPIDSGDFKFAFYSYHYGMGLDAFNAEVGAAIVRNATQWSDIYSIINKPPGAWEMYADQTQIEGHDYENAVVHIANDTFCYRAGKYGEILDAWPSQNFYIGGALKFWLDETFPVVALGDDWDMTSFTPVDLFGNTVPIPDTSGIWGGPIVGGFFNISVTDGKIFLHTQIYNVPSNWKSKSNDTAHCFGRLRFDTAPSLRGRVPISAQIDSNGNLPFSHAGDAGQIGGVDWIPTYKFSSAQPQFGMVVAGTENIDLCDYAMSVLSNQTATRIDDNKFTVPSPIADAKYATIHGAPAYYFNFNLSRGTVATPEWTFDNRTNGERSRLDGKVHCNGDPIEQPDANHGFSDFQGNPDLIKTTPCDPRMVVITRNSLDQPAKGSIVAFPDVFIFDETYGSKWQAQVKPTMVDKIWQEPHSPVNVDAFEVVLDFDPDFDTVTWKEDDGSCQDDSYDPLTGKYTLHYPMADRVEILLGLPGDYGAARNETPSDPFGVFAAMDFVDPVSNVDGEQPPGYITFGLSGYPDGVDTDFQRKERLCNVDGSCQFYADYLDMQIGCPPPE